MVLRSEFERSARAEHDRKDAAVGAAAEHERRLLNNDLNDAIARFMGDERNTGRRPLYASSESGPVAQKRKKGDDERRQALVRHLLEEQLRGKLARLYEDREHLYERLEQIERERQEIRGRVAVLDHQLQQLESIKAQALEEGRFAQAADGSLKDKTLEALVASHEQRTGQSMDRGDFDAVYAILLQKQKDLELQKARELDRDEELEHEATDVAEEIEQRDEQIAEAEALAERRDEPGFEAEAATVLENLDKYERANLAREIDESPTLVKNEPMRRSEFKFQPLPRRRLVDLRTAGAALSPDHCFSALWEPRS